MRKTDRIHPRRYLLMLAIAASVGISGCAMNRATGERHLNIISESQEIAMGQQADSQIVASIGLYQDAALQSYIQELGTRLAVTSERPGLPWTFRVVDDPAVNAFALPGGFIYVTRGLLTYVESEAELAGVVGHEIGHVTAQHSVHSMSNQQLTQLGMAAGVMIKPELEKYGQVLNAGLGLLYLKFSRDDESQADHLGLRYMVRTNNDPREMIKVFDMLNRVSQASGGGRIPEWLETHPNPENRSQDFQLEIDTMKQDLNSLKVNKDSYLTRIDGMVFGQNPRDGFFRDNRFYQPDLEFDFQFPTGWQTVNQKQAVAAVSANQDAIVQITLAPGNSIDDAATQFFSQQGLTSENREKSTINGLTAISGQFLVATDQGALAGKAVFVQYRETIYQILGYTTEQLWQDYEKIIIGSLGSFKRLTDTQMLQVQPLHLRIVSVRQAASLKQLATQENTSVPLNVIAIINQTTENAEFQAGDRIKMVVGKSID